MKTVDRASGVPALNPSMMTEEKNLDVTISDGQGLAETIDLQSPAVQDRTLVHDWC